MKAFIRFHLGLLRSPLRVKIWLAALLSANLAAPLFLLEHVEAQATLIALAVSMLLMTALTRATGFTRLLGLGHAPWAPLIAWLLARLDQIPGEGAFGVWVRILVLLNTASLVLDARDVWRFARGDRSETVSDLPDR